MAPNLPEPLEHVLRPLFDRLPMHEAMNDLVVAEHETDPELVQLVERIVASDRVKDRPDLVAGLWLYIDELNRSHTVSQSLSTPTGSFWHAIMHRREGDFANSKYWYRKAPKHPAMNRIDVSGGGAGTGTNVGDYDPYEFVDRVERADNDGQHHPELLALQHREWQALFEWCAEH